MAGSAVSEKKRGRKSGFLMTDEHRTKIANSQILKHLIEHVLGQRDMTATQVSAGIALMKKVLPDLQSVELSGDQDNPVLIRDMSAVDRPERESRDAFIARRQEELMKEVTTH